MKRLYRTLAVSLGIIFLGLIFSCKKKQEYVAGPKGDPGLHGDTGNVILSEVTFAASSWSLGATGWESNFQTGRISSKVMITGEVKVYMQIGKEWWSLPYGVGDVFMQATFEEQWVHLKYFEIHGGPPAKPDTVNFRAVILQPVN